MKPTHFSFVLHLHQPVGNFDSVFREHATQVYLPLLERLILGRVLPLGLHISGPLLQWLARHEPGFLELVRGRVEAGQVELLSSGRYEPILAALSPKDRAEQLRGMTELLQHHFGTAASTLWLTERVWEGAIVPELAAAGIENVLVDDWHFRVSGLAPDALVQPFRTEVGGVGMNLLPISEELRYLIPFSEVDAISDHLRTLAEREVPMVLFGDDGEKFGGWPRTREWVWDSGWIHRFVDCVVDAAERGWVELVTPSQAVERIPSGGLVYLGSASYSEMEEWTLPPELSGSYRALRDQTASAHAEDDARARVRGSHWRNFLVRYAEANRLHKKTQALSNLAHERGDPAPVRDAIGRAQSNDPLWHGVFGGIYMRHLREAAWRNLAEAEKLLRVGEPLEYDVVDVDGDGHPEVWVHSNRFSALISPARGGLLEELTVFETGLNEADVLTRYREAYHPLAVQRWHEHAASLRDAPSDADGAEDEGSASIHDLEAAYRLEVLPAADPLPRSLVVAHLLPADQGVADLEAGTATPLWSSAHRLGERRSRHAVAVQGSGPEARVRVEIVLPFDVAANVDLSVVKTLTFDTDGLMEVSFAWPGDACPEGTRWTVEVSQLDATAPLPSPDTAVPHYPVVTVPRSEQGFERIDQGHSHVMQWPAGLGAVRVSWQKVSATG